MTLTISRLILDELRAHALEQPDGWEATGSLLVRRSDDQVILYNRVRNWARQPGHANFSHGVAGDPAYYRLGIHAHPAGYGAGPSEADLRCTKARTFCIYGVDDDELGLFEILDASGPAGAHVAAAVGSYRQLRVAVE